MQIVVGRTGTEMLTNEAGEVTRLLLLLSLSVSTFVKFGSFFFFGINVKFGSFCLMCCVSIFFVRVAIYKGCLIERFVFLKLELSLCNALLLYTFSVGRKSLPFLISFANFVLNLLLQLCFRWKATGVKETRIGETVNFIILF